MKTLQILFPILFCIITFSILSAQGLPDNVYFGQEPPGSVPEIFAPGIVSLKNRFEQNVAFTPDGEELYFGITNNNWDYFEMYYTKQINGVWTEVESTTSILGNYGNIEPFITGDGEKLFFISIRPNEPPWNTDIWVSERNDTTWFPPHIIDFPVSTDNREWHPSVSNNGTIYFASLDQPEGYGAADIYSAELDDNEEYSVVTNLGETINSSYNDGEALIAPDESYLIFNSNRPGYGQSDIYISFNESGLWTDPINLGPNINTEDFEYATSFSPDNNYMFFTRREAWQTNEDSDIYWVSTSFIDSCRNVISNISKIVIKNENLFQIYSDPFDVSATIKYNLKSASNVTMKIYNLIGQEIEVIVDQFQIKGEHELIWQPERLSEGIYFCCLQIEEYLETKKLFIYK